MLVIGYLAEQGNILLLTGKNTLTPLTIIIIMPACLIAPSRADLGPGHQIYSQKQATIASFWRTTLLLFVNVIGGQIVGVSRCRRAEAIVDLA